MMVTPVLWGATVARRTVDIFVIIGLLIGLLIGLP